MVQNIESRPGLRTESYSLQLKLDSEKGTGNITGIGNVFNINSNFWTLATKDVLADKRRWKTAQDERRLYKHDERRRLLGNYKDCWNACQTSELAWPRGFRPQPIALSARYIPRFNFRITHSRILQIPRLVWWGYVGMCARKVQLIPSVSLPSFSIYWFAWVTLYYPVVTSIVSQ